jgi:hypothetical protein
VVFEAYRGSISVAVSLVLQRLDATPNKARDLIGFHVRSLPTGAALTSISSIPAYMSKLREMLRSPITTALENGATLDDVQRAAGHSEPGTTKLYDRRGYNPEKSASFFATY